MSRLVLVGLLACAGLVASAPPAAANPHPCYDPLSHVGLNCSENAMFDDLLDLCEGPCPGVAFIVADVLEDAPVPGFDCNTVRPRCEFH